MSFFRRPSAATQVQTPQYTALQVQTSSSALPIPILYGTNRLAPNILWSGDFASSATYSETPSAGKGLGGGGAQVTQTGYTYRTAVVFGLCEGPIADIGATYRQRTQSSGETGAINTAFGIVKGGSGESVIRGTTPQAPWGYLSTAHPEAALGYQGTALYVSSAFDLGSSASIGSLAFEVKGLLKGTSDVTAADADPAQVVFDYLTNPQFGVGFPAASIDAASLFGATGDGSYQTWCKAAGLALSPCLTDQESANATLDRWLMLTSATAIWSGGRLKVRPYGDAPLTRGGTSYQPNAVPVADLDDDDFLAEDGADPVLVTRSDPYAAPNVQRLEVLDRANEYAATPVEARDQNAIEQTGLRTASTLTAHEICHVGIGARAAQLILQRALYIRLTYAFRLSWEHCLLEPMDIVTLTDANLGLAQTPVRIVEIEEDEQGLLSVTAEEYPGTAGTAPDYIVEGSAGTTVGGAVLPASVNPPVIVEPPADLTNGVPQLWVGLSGGTAGIADPNWGGSVIFASTDGATYARVGNVTGPARQGVLTAPLAAPPDGTMAVSFARSGAVVATPPSPALLVVDGEFITYATATLTGPNAYAFGGLSRGVYGGRALAHAVGAQVLLIDKAVFRYDLASDLVGRPLWFKFASVNLFGTALQDLSTCTAYQATPVGSGMFGPVATALASGTSLDEGLASAAITERDDYGIASDPYVEGVDMGPASAAAQALAVQSGGTGATSPPVARQNIGAAAAGDNADITSLSNVAAIGIGTAADKVTNRLSVKSPGVLYDNVGAGVQAAINKATAGDTAAVVYQTGYSPRAYAGLLGNDRFRVSVSATGSSFIQALDIDPATGHVGLNGFMADANNALGVKGTAFLFDAEANSCRFTFNKAAAAHDASLTFQTGYGTRALAGLLGSDDWQLKVSADGTSYYQVMVADRTNGNLAFKALVGTASYTVAALPAGFNGAIAYASNGRKALEGAGAGTGVMAIYSNGAWRRLSDDMVVAA